MPSVFKNWSLRIQELPKRKRKKLQRSFYCLESPFFCSYYIWRPNPHYKWDVNGISTVSRETMETNKLPKLFLVLRKVNILLITHLNYYEITYRIFMYANDKTRENTNKNIFHWLKYFFKLDFCSQKNLSYIEIAK